MITLIGGGSRSGKSRYALERARQCSRPLLFLATGEARDDEMRARAEAHQRERGADFTTIEEPVQVERVLSELDREYGAVVVDCLTLWVANLMFQDPPASLEAEARRLVRTAAESSVRIFMVTNEVGCGIVPDNELSRRFRDHAGNLNQLVASAADEVYWMVFGQPLRVK